MKNKKLYRRTTDKYLTGLAGGIADYFDIDATVVRVVLIFLEFGTAGLLIIPYLIVSYFVPKQPNNISTKTASPTNPVTTNKVIQPTSESQTNETSSPAQTTNEIHLQ